MGTAPRVALIGCGRWGAHIVRDLLALGCDVPVAAHSDRSEERARGIGATTVVRDVADLPAVDGIVVATPTATHDEAVRSILDLDVPVFVEKPLTTSGAGARALVSLAPDRIFQMDKWRYHPGVECLRDLAQGGKLGEVQGVSCTRVQWGNPHLDVDAVWNLAPHDLSIVTEILGHLPEPVAATGAGGGGKEAELFGILGAGPFATVHVSGRSPVVERRVVVHGSERLAVLADGYAEVVEVHTPGTGAATDAELVPIGGELPLLRELRTFVDHLAGGPPPRSSGTDAVRTIEVLEQLRRLAGLDRG